MSELNYILRTYGSAGYWGVVQLATSEEYRDATDQEVYAAFVNRPTPTKSYFFRDPSLQVIAEKVAPEIAPPDRPLEVRHVGGGRGQEAYSFGALLAGNNISFTSTSIDVNPDVQPPTGKVPSFVYPQDPAAHFNNRAAARCYVRPFFFVEQIESKSSRSRATHRVTPKPALARHVRFLQHDLLDGPPPGTPDIVFARNIMYHYPWDTRDELLKHALGGMTTGIVALETIDNHKPVIGYKDWIVGLDRFGLTPCRQLRGMASLAIKQRVFNYDATKAIQPLRTRKNTLGPK